ncbi:integrase [Acetoanaerobium pronyense]|uniref:Integrase n=2 Tax=Acetoanaerobium pronyense TaxID=1482736 RepID=A0ABS4KJB0_9FIRM|nr:integrase [Acetoanaerobium pronyense]
MATGCRASTLRNIKIEDIDMKNKEIIFKHAKNRRQHIIPLADILQDVLKEYLIIRDGMPHDWLFCSRTGEKITKNCLTNSIITYNRRLGVERTGIHTFRHTFAKFWILNNGDVFRLQKILGHKNFEMTRMYVNMFGQDLKYKFDEYNPLSSFERKTSVSMNKFRNK